VLRSVDVLSLLSGMAPGVLIPAVDNDEKILRLLDRLLEVEGYSVLTAAS
jgi:CheY-like chemotaxis protein